MILTNSNSNSKAKT